MSTKYENKYPFEIKKEQLFPEKSFIDYCKFNYSRGEKIRNIDESFLKAAESDKFLEPLLRVKEKVQENGAEKEVLVNYYSPHQIFVIAALSKNQVYEGKLWVNEDLDFYKQQGFRMVSWGNSGFSFNIDSAQKGGKILRDINIFDFCRDFHNFLKFLHNLNQKADYYGPKLRHFTAAPALDFDLSHIGINMLSDFNLSVPKLILLRRNIAALATQIDPLESWYPYIKKHPRWRKDLLKGDALLAQEIYDVYDLITEIQEKISDEKPESIFKLVYSKYRDQYLTPMPQYVQGTDVKSLSSAANKLEVWMKKSENKSSMDESALLPLELFKKKLKEYEDLYGAVSFISNGIREVEIEENLKLEDLDPVTRRYVTQVVQQAEIDAKKSKRAFLSLWDDDLNEKVKRKEITPGKAKEEDRNLFIKSGIHNAIENRLSELRRELWAIFDIAEKPLRSKVDQAWNTVHDFTNYFWFNRSEELKKLSREAQLKLYDVEYKKTLKDAQFWSDRRDKFGSLESIMDLLYCSRCRSQPVLMHQGNNDEKISNNIICDSCLSDLSVEERVASRDAEIVCRFCGNLLFKFGHNNILSNLQISGAVMDLRLDYGRLKLSIKCKHCKEWNEKFLDWGWVE